MDAILEIVSKMYGFSKQFLEVDMKHTELRNKLQEVMSDVEDMKKEVRNEETVPEKKRKEVVKFHFKEAERYKESAQMVLNGSHEEQGIFERMSWVPSIERRHKEGQELLQKGRQLREEGLTSVEVKKRGEKLKEDQFMGNTFQRLVESALETIKVEGVKRIGIYGYAGPEKTNIMKHLYNKVYNDKATFKAVYWASAPEPDDHGNYNKALQKCVADEMSVDLGNDVIHDEVTSAGKIMARLQQIGPGHAVFFLDNLKKDFPAYEVLGIPSSMTSEVSCVNCILVVSTLSKSVCNRMQCDFTFKMELLERQEAADLFWHELKLGDHDGQMFSNQEGIQSVAVEVVQECARMPLAITIIARSMTSITNIQEWRNKLNVLKEKISSIDNEEDKILEQLKFGYICLMDKTVQTCFLDAAPLLANDRQVSKQDIITKWKTQGLIGTDRPSERADDQGQTILNELERASLLRFAPDNQTVTMNKWICKMAKKVI